MKGKENLVADALSIKDESSKEEACFFAMTVLDPVWLETLKESYL